jgi:hypothetical protein
MRSLGGYGGAYDAYGMDGMNGMNDMYPVGGGGKGGGRVQSVGGWQADAAWPISPRRHEAA